MEEIRRMVEETKKMVAQMGIVIGLQRKMMEQLSAVNMDLVNKLSVVNLLLDKALDAAKALEDDRK